MPDVEILVRVGLQKNMNSIVEDNSEYIRHLVLVHTNISPDDTITITKNLNYNIENNLDLFVDFMHNAYKQNNNINFFFNHQSEGLQVEYLTHVNTLFQELIKKCDIKTNQFHLVSGVVNCPRLITIYKQLCIDHSWELFPLWLDNYWESINIKLLGEPKLNLLPKSKRILTFNGIPRMHRFAAILEMYKRNIADKAYVSINTTENEFKSHTFEEIKRLLGDEFDYEDVALKHKTSFPMRLTLQSDIKNAYNINNDDKKLFNNTVVSLVNETIFSVKDPIKYKLSDRLTHPCTFATEKFWKTFQGYHPFIVMTTPHFLKDIRHLGYKTFAPYIDESYDDVEDDGLRFKMVMDEVEKICNMNDDQVYRFQLNVNKILQFNRKLMLTKKPEFVRVL